MDDDRAMQEYSQNVDKKYAKIYYELKDLAEKAKKTYEDCFVLSFLKDSDKEISTVIQKYKPIHETLNPKSKELQTLDNDIRLAFCWMQHIPKILRVTDIIKQEISLCSMDDEDDAVRASILFCYAVAFVCTQSPKPTTIICRMVSDSDIDNDNGNKYLRLYYPNSLNKTIYLFIDESFIKIIYPDGSYHEQEYAEDENIKETYLSRAERLVWNLTKKVIN
jgi:hypothetical protein